MLILWKARQKDPTAGYARTFLTQLEHVLGTCLDRGIRIVTNAGGLNPAGLAEQIHAMATRLGLTPQVAYLTGDDLVGRLDELAAAGVDLANIDTGAPLAGTDLEAISANAYLGGWGIAEGLGAGADIVVCPRVTDASLVVGPAAWWHGWRREDFDALAGAVAAGHVIECGPQATGGNYSFLSEITDHRYPGFPIAEVAADGSSVITKHDGTGGLVSPGTVTAQLLYEIASPAYANPDVVSHFDTLELAQNGPDRVRVSGTRGSAPPATLKVALNQLGGYRNTMTLVLTGLDIEAKAAHAEALLFDVLGGRNRFAEVDVRLLRFDHPDAPSNAEATAHLRITVKSPDPARSAGVLQRHHGTRARRVRRLPHHDPAHRRDRLRRVLARPDSRPFRRTHGGPAGRHPPGHPPQHTGRHHPTARHDRPSRRRSGRGSRPDDAGSPGPDLRGTLRRHGRQRQRRTVDPHSRGVRLAQREPDRREVPRVTP
jgi:hypothetical protein